MKNRIFERIKKYALKNRQTPEYNRRQVGKSMSILAIFLFFAGSSFPATFSALVWLAFFLLIASAMAINKALKIKKKYLDKVIGLDEASKKEDAKDEAKN